MDTNKIAELFDIVEEYMEILEKEDQTDSAKLQLSWKILSTLSQVVGIVNTTRFRAPGQTLVGKLILEESDRIIKKCTRLTGCPTEMDILKSMDKEEPGENEPAI